MKHLFCRQFGNYVKNVLNENGNELSSDSKNESNARNNDSCELKLASILTFQLGFGK